MKSIMIIDDDVSIGNMVEEVLTKEGYGVIRAYSGTEAKLLLSSAKPDLVLLDLMLPGLSGEELLPCINGIPVIVISAKADVNDKVDLLLNGAADYITKPFETKELLDRISEDTPDCMESSLKVHISNLRRKLRDISGKDYIEAVWGIGFKLKED